MADAPSLLASIHRNMQHLAARQQVLAQNIANSETPGYRSRDMEAPDFADLLASQGAGGTPRVGRPSVQLPGAMRSQGAVMPPGGGGVIYDTDVAETKPDGNNVPLEDQLLRMGEVQADFTAMAGLYRKQMNLIQTAIGKRGGA